MSRLKNIYLFLTAGLLLLAPLCGRAATLTLTNPTITATADLGTATFNYSFPAATNQAGQNVDVQLYLEDSSGNWSSAPLIPETTNTATGLSTPVAIPVFPGQTATGSFSINAGTSTFGTANYIECRCILFVDGSNFSQSVADFTVPITLNVTTTQIQVTQPEIVVTSPAAYTAASGTNPAQVSATVEVRWPQSYSVSGGGFWVMFKGSGGWAQNWVSSTNPSTATGLDNYYYADTTLVATTATTSTSGYVPTTPGLYNVQYGLFASSWGNDLQWIWPGDNVSIGNWLVTCNPANYPTLTSAFTPPGKAPIGIGGNWGNFIAQTYTPANDSSQYFSLLHAAGMSVIRFNFNPDWYLADPVYQMVVNQAVQNIMMGGAVPCIAPQDMPTGATLTARAAALQTLDCDLATTFKGEPIILDLCNEPHEYSTWALWAPVAQQIATAMRTIDPNCYIDCPTENFETSAAAASAAPLPTGTVNVYSIHQYSPAKLASGAYDPAPLGYGIPVWVQECYNTDPNWYAFLGTANTATITVGTTTYHPDVVGVENWAYTTPGQDSLALVSSVNGAVLAYTSDGQTINSILQDWINGTSLPSATTSSGASSGSGTSTTASSSDAAALAAIQAALATMQTQLNTIQASQTTDESAIKTNKDDITALYNYVVSLYQWVVANVPAK
jgi:hypothetical protein